MMYSGLELLADCWCSLLTAGIFLPSRRHLPALFGCLDAVGNTDQARTNVEGLEKLGTETHPKNGEHIQIKPLAVEQMEEAVVSPVIKSLNTDIAGNAGQISTATEAH